MSHPVKNWQLNYLDVFSPSGWNLAKRLPLIEQISSQEIFILRRFAVALKILPLKSPQSQRSHSWQRIFWKRNASNTSWKELVNVNQKNPAKFYKTRFTKRQLHTAKMCLDLETLGFFLCSRRDPFKARRSSNHFPPFISTLIELPPQKIMFDLLISIHELRDFILVLVHHRTPDRRGKLPNSPQGMVSVALGSDETV